MPKALNNLAYSVKRKPLIYFLEANEIITENRRCKEAIEDGYAVTSMESITDLYWQLDEDLFDTIDF